jgi:hypothetical protein
MGEKKQFSLKIKDILRKVKIGGNGSDVHNWLTTWNHFICFCRACPVISSG